MRNSSSLVLIVAAALIAGCATPPRRSPELARARNAVETLSSQPRAEENAGSDLNVARRQLHQAEDALRHGRSMRDVNQLAYLALRHAEAGQARVEAAQSQAQVARASQQRDRLLLEAKKREAMSAQQQAQSARQQVQSARKQARSARDEAQQARAQAQAAQQQLASERQQFKRLEKQRLGAHQTDQGMVMTLSNVLFSTGKSTLQPGAHLQLERLASYLKDHPKQRVLIEGNTDSSGAAAFNQKLSAARAQAVAQSLELHGVKSSQYRTIGLGEAYPVVSNDTAAGRQQNRRVDVVFSNASGQFSETALSRKSAIQR
ncbi:MAG: OmpA family protein [Proteobacteria bacterium]|nr:OmpA family protein [Pseudomonadota bacterium]